VFAKQFLPANIPLDNDSKGNSFGFNCLFLGAQPKFRFRAKTSHAAPGEAPKMNCICFLFG
jgi:hypothetical protein